MEVKFYQLFSLWMVVFLAVVLTTLSSHEILLAGECVNLEGHSNWAWSLTLSPDNQMLASGSQDETI